MPRIRPLPVSVAERITSKLGSYDQRSIYGSPGALRRAVTDKLRDLATRSRWTLQQLQRQMAYNRLLERLYLIDESWSSRARPRCSPVTSASGDYIPPRTGTSTTATRYPCALRLAGSDGRDRRGDHAGPHDRDTARQLPAAGALEGMEDNRRQAAQPADTR